MKTAEKVCPYCKTIIQQTDEFVICTECDMPHHKECWLENQGCTTFGCMGTAQGIKNSQQPINQEQQFIRCSYCAVQNKVGSKFCINCGLQVVAASADITDVPNQKGIQIPDEENKKQSCRGGIENHLQLFDQSDIELIEKRVAEIRTILEKNPILQRAYYYLEDDHYEKANKLLDDILDENPKEYMAYIGKLLADLCVHSEKDLIVCGSSAITKSKNFDRAFSTAPPKVKQLINKYVDLSAKLMDLIKIDDNYRSACALFGSLATAAEYLDLISSFKSLGDYKQSRQYLQKSVKEYEKLNAAEVQRVEERRIADEKAARERVENERQLRVKQLEEEEQRKAAKEKKRKKIKKTLAISLPSAGICAVLILSTIYFFIPFVQFNSAQKKAESGNYDEAISIFMKLGNFLDSNDQLNATYYDKAASLMENSEYLSAKNTMLLIENYMTYKNCAELIPQCDYNSALELFSDEKYESAAIAFYDLGNYSDSKARYQESTYLYAEFLYAEKKYEGAYNQFKKISSYKDAEEWSKKSYYNHGNELINTNRYESAVQVFNTLGSYSNSKEKLNEAKYAYVIANNSRNNTTTMNYLEALMAIRYKDSTSIYNLLTKWYVSIVVNTSEYDETSDRSSISTYNTIYFHVKVSGGPPSGSILLKYSYQWPGYTAGEDSWDYSLYDGATSGVYWDAYSYWGESGTMTFKVYNKSTGELLATKKVYISS